MRASSVNEVILEILAGEAVHLNAHEVYSRLRLRLPAVNPSTVYRALDRLAASGKISVSDMGDGAAVFELVEQPMHHHLVCQKCKQVITLRHEDVANFFQSIEDGQQFKVLTNHLVLFGLCAKCQGDAFSDRS